MDQLTLEACLKKDDYTKKIFGRVIAIKELPIKPKYPSIYIINNKPRNHPGEHWLALYYDEYGVAHFFDSYGRSPSSYGLEKFLKGTSNEIQYNSKRIQGYSDYCGYYCLLFLLLRSRGKN